MEKSNPKFLQSLPGASSWGWWLTPEKHSPPPEAPATLSGSHPQLLWHQGRRSYEDLMPDI